MDTTLDVEVMGDFLSLFFMFLNFANGLIFNKEMSSIFKEMGILLTWKWVFGFFIPYIDRNNMVLTLCYLKGSEMYLILRDWLKEAKETAELNAMCGPGFI